MQLGKMQKNIDITMILRVFDLYLPCIYVHRRVKYLVDPSNKACHNKDPSCTASQRSKQGRLWQSSQDKNASVSMLKTLAPFSYGSRTYWQSLLCIAPMGNTGHVVLWMLQNSQHQDSVLIAVYRRISVTAKTERRAFLPEQFCPPQCYKHDRNM